MLRVALSILLAAALTAPRPSAAQDFDVPVDVELVLAVDISGSMDYEEHRVQRDGYVAALGHPDVLQAVRTGAFQRIALTYVEWAGPSVQRVAMPWTILADEEDAQAIADHIAAASLSSARGTSISGILDFAVHLFDGNGFEGTRQVIDISGDGPNNMGAPVVPARDRTLARGITINGLPIMIRPSLRGGGSMASLDAYFRDCVIGGPGAFVLPVSAIEEMADAIRMKLVLDIAGPPSPDPRVVPAQASASVDCMVGERNRPGFWREP